MPTPSLAELVAMGAGSDFLALTQSDMSGFTMEHVQQLSGAQLAAMSVDQINGIGNMIMHFTNVQIPFLALNNKVALLTPIFMANIGAKLNTLNNDALGLITPLQAQALTGASLASLSAAQISSLSDEALYNLKPEAVNDISSAVIADVVPEKLAQLSTASILGILSNKLSAVTPAQISATRPSVFSELTTEILTSLNFSHEQIAAITSEQMPNITLVNLPILYDFSLSAMAALTGYQVSQLTKAQIQTITPGQMEVLQPGAIASLALHFTSNGDTNPILNTVAIMEAFTLAQLRAFGKRVYWLNYNIDADQYASLTSEQAKALFDRNGENWAEITPSQIKAFSPADLESFPAINRSVDVYKAMTPAQLSGFSTSSVGLITGAVIAQLNPSQFAALNLAHLNTSTNPVSGLVPVASSITLNQLKALSPAKAATLTPAMLGLFNDNQLSALTIKNTLSSAQLAGLSAAQVEVVTKIMMVLNYTEEKKYFATWNMDANVHETKKMKLFITKDTKEVTSSEKCYTISYSDEEFEFPNLEPGHAYLIYALYYDKQDNLNTTKALKIGQDSWPAARPVIICTRETTRSFHVSVDSSETIKGALVSYNTGFEAYGQYFEGPPTFSYGGKLSYVVEDERIILQSVEVSMVIYTEIPVVNGSVTQMVKVASELSETILVSLDVRPNPVDDLTAMYAKDEEGVVFMNVQWTPGIVYNNSEIVGYALTTHNLTKKEKREIVLPNVTSYSYYKDAADDYGDSIQFSIRGFYFDGMSDEIRNDSDEVSSNELKVVGFSANAPSNISDSLHGDKFVRTSGNAVVAFTVEPKGSLGRISSEVMYVARVFNSNNHASPVATYYMYNDNTEYTTSISGVQLVNGYSIPYTSTALFDNVYVTVTEMVANMNGSEITEVLESSVSSSAHAFFVPASEELLYTSSVSSTGAEMVSGGLKVEFTGEITNPSTLDLSGLVYHQDIFLDGVKMHENTLPKDFSHTYPAHVLNDNQTSIVVTYCTLPFPTEKIHPALLELYEDGLMFPFERSESASIQLVNVTPQEMDFSTEGVSQTVNVTWSLLPNIPKDKLSQVISVTLNDVLQTVTHTPIVVDGDSCSTTVSGLTNNVVHKLTLTNQFDDYNLASFSTDLYIQSYNIADINIQNMIVSNQNNRASLSCAFLLNQCDGFTLTGFETTINNTVIKTTLNEENPHGAFSLPSALTGVLSPLRDAVDVLKTGFSNVQALTFSAGYDFEENKNTIHSLTSSLANKYLTDPDNEDAAVHLLNKLKFLVGRLDKTLQALADVTSVERANVDFDLDCQNILDLIEQLTTSRNYWVYLGNLPVTFTNVYIRAVGNFTSELTNKDTIYGTSMNFNADKVSTAVSNLTYDSTLGNGTVNLAWDGEEVVSNPKYSQTLFADWPETQISFSLDIPIDFTDSKYRTTALLPPGWNFLITVVASYADYTNFDKTEANAQSYLKSSIFASNEIVAQKTSRTSSNFNFLLTIPERGFTLNNYSIEATHPTLASSVPYVSKGTYVLNQELGVKTLPEKSAVQHLKESAAELSQMLLALVVPYNFDGLAAKSDEIKGYVNTINNTSLDTNAFSLEQLKNQITFLSNEITLTVDALKDSSEDDAALRPNAILTAINQLSTLDELIVKFLLARGTWVTADFTSEYTAVTITIHGKDSNDHDITGTDTEITGLVGNSQSVYSQNYDNTDGTHNQLLLYWDSGNKSISGNNFVTITARSLLTDMPIALTYATPTYSNVSPTRFNSTVTGFTKNINYLATIFNYSSVYTNFAIGTTNAQTYDKETFYIDNMIVATAPNPASHLNFNMNNESGVSSSSASLTISGKNNLADSPTVVTPDDFDKVVLSLPAGLIASMTALKQKAVVAKAALLAYIASLQLPSVPSFTYDESDLYDGINSDGTSYTVVPYALNHLYQEIVFRRNEVASLASAIKAAASADTLSILPGRIDSLSDLIDEFIKPRNQIITRTMGHTFNSVEITPKGKDLNQHDIEGTSYTVQVDKVNTTVSNLSYDTTGVSQTATLSWISKIPDSDSNFHQYLTATLQNGTDIELTTSPFVCQATGTSDYIYSTTVSNAPNGDNITYTIRTSYTGLSNFNYDTERGQAYNKPSFVLTDIVKTPLNEGYMLRFDVMVPKNMRLSGFHVKDDGVNLNGNNISFTPAHVMNTTQDADHSVTMTISGLTNDTEYNIVVQPIAEDQNEIARDGTAYLTLNCYPRIVPSKILTVTTDLLDNSIIRVNMDNSSIPNTSQFIDTLYTIYRKKYTESDTAYVIVNTRTYTAASNSYSWSDIRGDNNNGNTYIYKVVAELRDMQNSSDLVSTLQLFTDLDVNVFSTMDTQDLYDAPKLRLDVTNGIRVLTLNMNGAVMNGLVIFTTTPPEFAGNMNPVTVDYYDQNSLSEGGTLLALATRIAPSYSGISTRGTWTINMGVYTPGSNVVALAWNKGGAGTATIGGSVLGIETSNEVKLTSYNNVKSDANDFIPPPIQMPVVTPKPDTVISGDVLANMNTTGMTMIIYDNGVTNEQPHLDDGFSYLPFTGMDFYFNGRNYGNSNGSSPETSMYINTNGALGFGRGTTYYSVWPANFPGILFDFYDRVVFNSYVSPPQNGTISGLKYVRIVTTARDYEPPDTTTINTAYEIYYVRDSQYQYLQFNCNVKSIMSSKYSIVINSDYENPFGLFNAAAGKSYVLVSDLDGRNWRFYPNTHLNL